MERRDIINAVNAHHYMVKDKFPDTDVVMTVLIGSNNYKLDTPESDIDTITFIMPPIKDIVSARDPISGEFEVEDGKCIYKDIRLALNLLKKTSPNSVEYFVGKYKAFSARYKTILEKYLDDDEKMNKMVHCNYNHMLYAIAGMAHQLTKRNMPVGKRYSHALRLRSMVETFTTSLDHRYLLELLPRDYNEAYTAKRDDRDLEYYHTGCELIAQYLESVKETFEMSEFKKNIEKEGLALIDQFQTELVIRYLKEELE